MGIIGVTIGGSTEKTERFLSNMQKNTLFDALETFGQEGVTALELATPRDTGAAAGSWYYEITRSPGGARIEWHNSDRISGGTPIVVLLQYGHATGTGGWVPGRDFINPALKPVMDKAANAVWKAVQS